jgi:hypothetical protein
LNLARLQPQYTYPFNQRHVPLKQVPLWFDTDAIIDGVTNALLAAEITLSGLYRDMSEQELNLLQLSSCGVPRN